MKSTAFLGQMSRGCPGDVRGMSEGCPGDVQGGYPVGMSRGYPGDVQSPKDVQGISGGCFVVKKRYSDDFQKKSSTAFWEKIVDNFHQITSTAFWTKNIAYLIYELSHLDVME